MLRQQESDADATLRERLCEGCGALDWFEKRREDSCITWRLSGDTKQNQQLEQMRARAREHMHSPLFNSPHTHSPHT